MEKSSDARIARIFDQVLKEIKPDATEAQRMTERVNTVMWILKDIVPPSVELRVAGSISRGTNLKGDGDIDIFMLFSKRMKRDDIVKLGLQYGKKVISKEKGRYEVKYAEHPYVRLYLDSIGIKVDLVPAFKIDSIDEMGTTVDRTPMHTEFINDSLSLWQKDEVRILKCFLKAHRIYGAEVKVNGFSGYLCELLVHHYGSLHKVLLAVSRLRLPVVIDPRSRKEIADKEVARRFNSGFVVIDPVDEGRNVAAGVSLESLGRFAIAARQFLALPSLGAFSMSIPSTVSASAMIRKLMSRAGLDIFIVACGVPDKSEDVIYPQLRKVNQQIIRHLQSNGFTVFESVQLIHGNTGYMAVIAPAQRITSRMLKGPDIFMSNATSQFIKTHRGAYGFAVNGTSIYAIERGRYASIDTALKKLPRKMLKHKDISLSSSRVLVNSVPGRIAVPLYLELNKKLSI